MDRLKTNAQVINPPIVARFIRVVPKNWHGHPALRVEFYGCRTGACCTRATFVSFCVPLHYTTSIICYLSPYFSITCPLSLFHFVFLFTILHPSFATCHHISPSLALFHCFTSFVNYCHKLKSKTRTHYFLTDLLIFFSMFNFLLV